MNIPGLYQKRGVWYYQPQQVNGVRPKAVSLRTRDDRTALRRYEKLKREAISEIKKGKLKLEVEVYLREQAEHGRHTAETSRSTREALERLIEFLGPAAEVSDSDAALARLVAFQKFLLKTQKPVTNYRFFGRISGFYTWAVRKELITSNPVKRMEFAKRFSTKCEDYCTKEERDRLVTDVPRQDVALILWLGFFAGMRTNEIVEARTNWIDLQAGVISVRATDTFTPKGKRHRRIQMSGRLREFLAGYMARWPELPGAEKQDYLLRPDKRPGKKRRGAKQVWRYRVDLRAGFNKWTQACDLGWVTRHTMRHTFGTLHALSGTPMHIIARELGDSIEITYQNYVGYTRHNTHADAAD